MPIDFNEEPTANSVTDKRHDADDIISIEGLERHYGCRYLFHDVSISIREGNIHVFFGSINTGFHSLLEVLSGVQSSTSGSIRLEGEDITGSSELQRIEKGIIYPSKRINLYDDLTVEENTEFLVNELGGEEDNKVKKILEKTSLENDATTLFGELRLAKKKILKIGLGTLFNPKVMLVQAPKKVGQYNLDDPIMKLISSLNDNGISFVMTGERIETIRDLSDTVSFVTGKTTVEHGTYNEILYEEIEENNDVQKIRIGENRQWMFKFEDD